MTTGRKMHACGYRSMHGGARLHVFGGAYIFNYMVVYIMYNNQHLQLGCDA